MTVEEFDAHVEREVEKRVAMRELFRTSKAVKKAVFAAEVAIDYDVKRAKEVADYFGDKAREGNLKAEEFREEIANARMSADYVHRYMLDVLELCPTDFFTLAPDGTWCIDLESFHQLPREVKRLVQGFQLKYVGGVPIVTVDFVSKQQVLAIAAKYCFIQRIQASISTVPWDQVTLPPADSIERRLEAYGSQVQADVASGTASADARNA